MGGIEPAAWRVLAVFRWLALGYAVAVHVANQDGYRHRTGAWLLLIAMALWTAVVTVAYRSPRGRTWAVVGPDLAVALAAIVGSRFLDSPAHIVAGSPTLPIVWTAAPVLAWALRGGWLSGVVAALAVGIADVIHRQGLSTTTVTNVVLLVLGGALVGYVVPLAREGEVALAQAEAAQSAARERARLSRDIHDGVLQALALIHRRGREIGGPADALATLAAEQEQALRALVAADRVVAADRSELSPDGVEIDLLGLLADVERDGVTVSAPVGPVPLPPGVAAEVRAAVGEALANVSRHAGPAARAWVLVDDDGSEVVVVIRDDGPGFPVERLDQARRDGRLGVAGSIMGRMEALGGTATVEAHAGEGTEVTLRVRR